MPARINQNRSAAPAAKPSSPKNAKASAPRTMERPSGGWSPQAAAAWGSKAPSKLAPERASTANTLTLVKASLDEGREAPKGFPAPEGFKLSSKEETQTESIKMRGGAATFEIRTATLAVKNEKTGKTVELEGPRSEAIAEMKEWFHESFDKGAGEDLPMREWDSSHGFSGYSTAGQLVSVREHLSSYTGGARPDAGSVLGTYDLRSGRPVKLSHLLTAKQFQSVVQTIEKQLPNLKSTGDEEFDGSAFVQDSDTLRETIDANFALVTGKNGTVQLDVSWESGVHALGSLAANFTFDAPTDAEFREKIGAE